jgi:hypothetical protein
MLISACPSAFWQPPEQPTDSCCSIRQLETTNCAPRQAFQKGSALATWDALQTYLCSHEEMVTRAVTADQHTYARTGCRWVSR